MEKQYYCHQCKNIFSEYDMHYLNEYDTGEGGYGNLMYSIGLCPECDSEDIDEAHLCPVCGEWHDPEDGDICSDCKKDISALWLDLLSNLKDFADAEEVAKYIYEVLV